MKPTYGNIEPVEGSHVAGIIEVKIVPREWLAEPIRLGFNTVKVISEVVLLEGREWITLKLIEDTYKFDEKPKSARGGSFFEISLEGLTNDIDPLVWRQLKTWRYHEFVVLLKDKQKRLRLAGDQNIGMRLQYNNDEQSEQGGTQKVTINLQMESEDPVPFYLLGEGETDIDQDGEAGSGGGTPEGALDATIISDDYTEGENSIDVSFEIGCDGGNWYISDSSGSRTGDTLSEILDSIVELFNTEFSSYGSFSHVGSTIRFTPAEDFAFSCGDPVFVITVASETCVQPDLDTGTNYPLPDAQVGVPYNVVLGVFGSQPFTLTGISKPDWLTIEIDGNDITFSGTPESGDVGTDINIIFTIENCSEFVYEFNEAIDVTEEAGEISVTNTVSGLSITDVTGVPGFTFDTGSPVGMGGEQNGTTVGSGGATVTVSISGTPPGDANITININGVPQDCENVPGTDDYILSLPAYTTADDIGISLSTGDCP